METIPLLSEVWEKTENKLHQKRLEELFQMEEISYLSTACPGTKRGGGAAIAAESSKFFISKLNIDIPKPLEIVWSLLRPKNISGSINKIIV